MDCELTLKGHTGGIRNLDLLDNGCLVSASYDKTLKVWNLDIPKTTK